MKSFKKGDIVKLTKKHIFGSDKFLITEVKRKDIQERVFAFGFRTRIHFSYTLYRLPELDQILIVPEEDLHKLDSLENLLNTSNAIKSIPFQKCPICCGDGFRIIHVDTIECRTCKGTGLIKMGVIDEC